MEPESGVVLEALSEEECLALLREHRLGRLAVSTPSGPAIFPVNYAVGGDRIVFRTDPGTKLEAAALRVVVFEIDAMNPDDGTGWSVVVEGTGTDITGAIDEPSEALDALAIRPMAPGPKAHVVEIIPRSISGRRLVAH